jgi:hypothetical protein
MFCRFHRSIAHAIGVLLVGAAGCQAPFSSNSDSKQLETAHHRAAANEVAAEVIDAPTIKAASAAADEATIANVVTEAREISAKNPAAGKLLLEELSRSEPKLWPLVVQQFRSEQAYHDLLVAKAASAKPKRQTKTAPPAGEPPSAEVGQLADPRRIRSDAAIEQAFAAVTPANMPAPLERAPSQTRVVAQAVPHVFLDDASAHPLASVDATVPSTESVRQASLVEDPASRHADRGVQQALLTTDAKTTTDRPANGDWQSQIALAIDDLNARVADGPRSTAEVHQLVSLRLLHLLVGDTEAALEPIPNVSTEEQDYWSGQIFALATLLDHHRQPDEKRRAAASVVHLDEAVGHLRELGTLSLRNLAFCKSVYGYGAYEPINDPVFTPGQQVTLYLEVENYHSESTAKGYKTLLGTSYEVVDDSGERIASGEFPNVEDTCQSRRRDFHIQYGLVLPKSAKAGPYHLKLAMRDRQSDKLGSASIDFEVR